MIENDITVVIPTIPPRAHMLRRAIRSVNHQYLIPKCVEISLDTKHEGAATTRNRGIEAVKTRWTALLDDDDTLLPQHLQHLLELALDTRSDLVYPWFYILDAEENDISYLDPLYRFGMKFDEKYLREINNYIAVTVLVRTELLQEVGGFRAISEGDSPCDDHGCWLALLDAGARFSHLPERTWNWFWHGLNTSGRGDRW